MRSRRTLVPWLSALAGSLLSSCAFAPARIERSTPAAPTAQEIRQLWVEPANIAARDLFHGPGGVEMAPAAGGRFEFLSRKATGFSPGWDVKDSNGLEWSVKAGPEAQVEVTVSRLLWAVGYHQPPTYYLQGWSLTGSPEEGRQYNARFRPEPKSLDRVGNWSWHQNPFVGTVPYRGLLVLMMVVNNWDLLARNNVIYALDPPRDGVARWYVTRDLGAALGRSRAFPQGTRNDVEGFEEQGFIQGVVNGRVRFAYAGRHGELLNQLTPADVRWACERLARLSPRQWDDAFRAGGFERERAVRFIRRLQAKVEQGRRLGAEEKTS